MKLIVCDHCGRTINGAIIPVGFADERKDACSSTCARALMQLVEGYAGSKT